MKKKELRASVAYWRSLAVAHEKTIAEIRAARESVIAPLRRAMGQAVAHLSSGMVAQQAAALITSTRDQIQGMRASNDAVRAILQRALEADEQSALGLVALAETAAAHLADLATLRQQAATDRKLAGEAADEAARLQEELERVTRNYDSAVADLGKVGHLAVEDQRHFAAEKVRLQGDLDYADARLAEARKERDHWKAEAENMRAAWNQETADRVKAEEAPRALPWRDAKTDPPPVDEYVLGQWGPQSFNEVRRAADDEWRDLTGDALDTPFHWLPLSALEPGECVTVDLPEVGYIGVDRWTLIKCGEGVAECPIWLPAGTQIPARWKGKRLRLTLEPAAGPAGEAKPDDRANHLRLLLAKVDLRGRSFQIGAMGSGHYLQIVYRQTCVDTGEEKEQHGRKWYLSAHATDGEVVQTALKAALTSAEHEVREHFTYQGARVFGPHFDLDALVSLCQQGSTQKRQP